MEEDEQQLKISCLDGAIRYLNSSKIGNIKVSVKNDIPIVPYSLHGTKYTGEEIEILRTGEQAGSSSGYIKKISSTEILPLHLKNKEQEIKKYFTYINKPEDYKEIDEQEVLSLIHIFKRREGAEIRNPSAFIGIDKEYNIINEIHKFKSTASGISFPSKLLKIYAGRIFDEKEMESLDEVFCSAALNGDVYKRQDWCCISIITVNNNV